MYCEIIDCYFNVFFFCWNTTEKRKHKRVWVAKLVYWSPKRPEYVTNVVQKPYACDFLLARSFHVILWISCLSYFIFNCMEHALQKKCTHAQNTSEEQTNMSQIIYRTLWNIICQPKVIYILKSENMASPG